MRIRHNNTYALHSAAKLQGEAGHRQGENRIGGSLDVANSVHKLPGEAEGEAVGKGEEGKDGHEVVI